MKISIAMATFNGARYIRDQLESLIGQERRPDELVISDDGSADDTVGICERFRARAPFDVTMVRNERRLGYAGNFGAAMELCSGDIVMLSDQDDWWFPHKIETVAAFFEVNPSMLVVINDAELADAELRPLGVTKTGHIRAAGLRLDDFATGCCTSVRAEFAPLILPIPPGIAAHDTWIHVLGRSLGRRMVLPSALQYLRRHGGNASDSITSATSTLTVRKAATLGRRADRIVRYGQMLRIMDLMRSRFAAHGDALSAFSVDPPDISAALSRADLERKALCRRLGILERRMPWRAVLAFSLLFAGGYKRFNGWKSFMNDCLG